MLLFLFQRLQVWSPRCWQGWLWRESESWHTSLLAAGSCNPWCSSVCGSITPTFTFIVTRNSFPCVSLLKTILGIRVYCPPLHHTIILSWHNFITFAPYFQIGSLWVTQFNPHSWQTMKEQMRTVKPPKSRSCCTMHFHGYRRGRMQQLILSLRGGSSTCLTPGQLQWCRRPLIYFSISEMYVCLGEGKDDQISCRLNYDTGQVSW